LRAGSRRGDPWSPAYLGSAACAGHHKSVVDESGRHHPGQKAAFNVGSIINASGPAKLPLASNHRILGQSNRRAVRVEEMEGADCGMAGWRSDTADVHALGHGRRDDVTRLRVLAPYVCLRPGPRRWFRHSCVLVRRTRTPPLNICGIDSANGKAGYPIKARRGSSYGFLFASGNSPPDCRWVLNLLKQMADPASAVPVAESPFSAPILARYTV
jgi:hypothetical protein